MNTNNKKSNIFVFYHHIWLIIYPQLSNCADLMIVEVWILYVQDKKLKFAQAIVDLCFYPWRILFSDRDLSFCLLLTLFINSAMVPTEKMYFIPSDLNSSDSIEFILSTSSLTFVSECLLVRATTYWNWSHWYLWISYTSLTKFFSPIPYVKMVYFYIYIKTAREFGHEKLARHLIFFFLTVE